MKNLEKDFVKFLYSKKCIKIASNKDEFFLLKSGRKCPFFINLGSLIDGHSLSYLADAYATKIYRLIEEKEIANLDYIYGPAYKGIVIGSLVCAKLYEKYKIQLKFIYDRKEQKGYGDQKADSLIVGQDQIEENGSVLMIDDVITSGKAKIEAYQKLINVKKVEMVGVLVGVDREEIGVEGNSAKEEIERVLGCKVYSIINIGDIYSTLIGKISTQQREYILDYIMEWGEEKTKIWAKMEKEKLLNSK
ncbi:MAG: orotate phosphoribosyltransferase [Candidatus Micrarchaeota archaeon]|nr:orotate phosphoribosyltransferase [Candidatus Micrarchaeota archaeon]